MRVVDREHRFKHVHRRFLMPWQARWRQYLYFCSSNLYFCTSKASKVGIYRGDLTRGRMCSSSRGVWAPLAAHADTAFLLRRTCPSRPASYLHTSAYVSIRQHTSACVCIRLHTPIQYFRCVVLALRLPASYQYIHIPIPIPIPITIPITTHTHTHTHIHTHYIYI